MAEGGEGTGCAKVGQLILQLRRERGLTQREVAGQLGISDKTVSKWGCGVGCPDVSLWEELSVLPRADIRKLLQGELNPNQPDVDKLDRMQFYVCPTCGNILASTGAATVSRCGRQLNPLEADKDIEGHEMTVQIVDSEYYITFDHEISKEHYILFATHVYDDRVLLNHFYPEQKPAFRLPMIRRIGSLYFYCTKYGLRACWFKYKI